MHYRHNEFQNFLQNLPLDAHDALHRKSRPTLAFIRHCSRVGGGNDKLAIDKAGNLPEKVENHCFNLCVWKCFTSDVFYVFYTSPHYCKMERVKFNTGFQGALPNGTRMDVFKHCVKNEMRNA